MSFKTTNKIVSKWKTALLAAVYALCFLSLSASVTTAAEPFSFLVIGDTRTEPFVSGGKDQTTGIMQLLNKRYNVNSENTVLTFDDSGTELVSVKMVKKKYTRTINYQGGWPQTIVLTDQKSKKTQVVMRSSGRQWVSDQLIADMQKGAKDLSKGASFIVHGGDIQLFGIQGNTAASNPYYQLFTKELLMHLPTEPNAPGLPGNLFSAVGNHATWGDDEIVGFRETLPWLKQLNLSATSRIYSFVQNNCSFIFLDSGGWSPAGTAWSSNYPKFSEQMDYLKAQLDSAKAEHRDHVFVTYHKPSFNQIGHNPLPKDQNPHEILKTYADDLSIFVFSSHVHTTEQYLVDKINYLVIGGGGAPQKFKASKKPSPERELYWQGGDRTEEYNYLNVAVNGSHISGTINRFRPLVTSNPFSSKVIFQK